MIPDLYLHKSPWDDDEVSDTVFSALDTPRNLDTPFDDYINVANKQEDYSTRSRELPEHRGVRWVVFPDDPGREMWEAVVLLYGLLRLMSYAVTVTPYRVAFVETDDTLWEVLDYLVDSLFFVDVVLNFFTAYKDRNEQLVVNHKRIAMNYLSSWFLVDIFSCFPFQVILDEGFNYNSLLRMGRLPRLYRIVKLSK